MPLTNTQWRDLEDKAHELRSLCLDTCIWAGSGHIGGSLSAMDLMTVLYHHVMRFDASALDDPDRDRFVLSKGHIGVGIAPVLADLGCFPREWLKEYNHTNSPLGIHPDSKKVPGIEFSTGSLGHGLSLALGAAMAARVLGRDYRTFCLMGDGECNEGSVWEAAMAAAAWHADTLIAFVDRNHAMMDGPTEQVMGLEPFTDKWRAFGWHTVEVDGQDIPALVEAIDAALAVTGQPSVVLMDTVKGAGIDFIEGDYKWHYGSFDAERAEKAHAALDAYHDNRLARVKEH